MLQVAGLFTETGWVLSVAIYTADPKEPHSSVPDALQVVSYMITFCYRRFSGFARNSWLFSIKSSLKTLN
jgi:hypothetical protein